MKKLFTLLLGLTLSVGTILAQVVVRIGQLYYEIDEDYSTTQVMASSTYSELTTVNIPSSVTYNGDSYEVLWIEDHAFANCTNLTSVVIPNSVNTIGDYAFYHCTNLTSIIIPNSVTSIGDYAFAGCYRLTSLTLSDCFIGDYAFSGCTGLTGELFIPNGVSGIAEGAFSGCTGLTSIVIPKSVTSIGNGAFYGCTGLTKVHITDIVAWCNISFSSLAANPLNYAKHLYLNDLEITNLIIPGSVKSIGDYAFANCSELTSVTIGNSVTSIGSNAFNGCSNITSVAWNAKNCSSPSSYWNSPFNNVRSQITSFTFGDEVKSIPAYLCYGMSKLTSVEISNSVTSIGGNAFYGCSGLTSVEIPNSVTSIGESAFYGCSGLTSVEIPNSVTSIGESAFYNVPNIVYNSTATGSPWGARSSNGYIDGSLVYSDNTKTNLLACFSTATGEISIPNSVTSIGDYAFANCSELTSVTIGNSVTSIGSNAFNGCSNITSVTWNAENCSSPSSYSNSPFNNVRSQITSFTFGDEVETIPDFLCFVMNNLSSITIPSGVTSIGSSAFSGCSNITTVAWNAKNCNSWNFGSQVETFIFGDEVETIPNSLCQGMNLLTSITIPSKVTGIGANAFNGCSGLTSIEIPESVTSIGSNAFNGCTNITSVAWNARNCNSWYFGSQVETFTFGDEVETIPDTLCKGMNLLTSVSIPNSVTNIGDRAFKGCSNLTVISVGNNVTNLGLEAFYGCTKITSLTAPAMTFDIAETEWINYSKQLENVVVNAGELTEDAFGYIARSYKRLRTLDVSATTNTNFADEAFKGYYNLEVLRLPTSLESVSYMMAAGCKNLNGITIPALVSSIDQSAFEDCRSITQVTFEEGSQLTQIGNWAFYNCHELANIDIPEGVTEIGNAAFYGCTYLQTAHIPTSVQSIGNNAFALCSKLTQMNVDAVEPPTVENKTFYEVSTEAPVYVPDESVTKYKSHAIWGKLNIQGQHNIPAAIDQITDEPSQKATKVIREGQVLILRGRKTYTITGQEVK